ncbi:metallophosphoesterase family protein [Bifidobacterium callitrichidarum]|uniref:Metallophosphoesterase n=1 Tax=Bifidobacterium callitrichidarum TaxID=2052941 RepID=A0A2U2N987_9BIFI|nr:metallophosphoesterase family protein [Bifidobacterium callitrichidarum]PWG65652.1 metallophosphoesterase [Bifidobacterium callitrichidarum]
MSTLFVGDLHGKPDLLPLISRVADRENADRIVLLGDVCDDWGLSNNMMSAWFKTFADWSRSEGRRRDLIPLLGNHDIPYMLNNGSQAFDRVRNIAPGFRPGAHRRVNELMQHIPFRVAWSDGSLLATHAGVTDMWEIKHDLRNQSPLNIAAWLNKQMEHSASLANLYMEIGAARGGTSKTPSPVWADLTELLRDGDHNFIQIVGHSPVETVTESNGFWFCDTFSTTQDGRNIGDGTLLFKSNKGKYRKVPLLG